MKRLVSYAIICVGLLVSCAHKSGHRSNSFVSSETQVYENERLNQSEGVSDDYSLAARLDKSNQLILKRTAYSMSYNPELLIPNVSHQ